MGIDAFFHKGSIVKKLIKCQKNLKRVREEVKRMENIIWVVVSLFGKFRQNLLGEKLSS